MIRCLEIQEGGLFKDRAELEVKVERIDANKRIRFSVVGNQATIAGPGEMSYESFVTRFSPVHHQNVVHS
jgi:hypothetical protein